MFSYTFVCKDGTYEDLGVQEAQLDEMVDDILRHWHEGAEQDDYPVYILRFKDQVIGCMARGVDSNTANLFLLEMYGGNNMFHVEYALKDDGYYDHTIVVDCKTKYQYSL